MSHAASDASLVNSLHAQRGRRRTGWVVAAVVLYAGCVLLPFLGSSRTLTSHEAMVTHPAQRILEDGNWIVPRFASGFWLDKPPLVNWLVAAAFAVSGGFSEVAARIPAALSAIGLCALVAGLAVGRYGTRVALLAGFVQATCVYTYMQGRLGEIDMTFALLLGGAQAILAAQWADGRFRLPPAAAFCFHGLLGLAVLAKGAIGVVLVGASVLCFCALRRSWAPLRAVILTPGVIAFVATAGTWHVAAYLVAGDEALTQWGYNSILRFFGLHHLGAEPPWFYVWAVIWLVAPWSIALLIGGRWLYRDARRSGAIFEQFLWAWFLGGFLFLTICFFKHKHYIIPALPPLSIFAARVLDLHIVRGGVHARRFYVITLAIIPLVYGVIGGVVMPQRDHRQVTHEFVRRVTSELPEDTRLYVVGLGQSSVYPYIRHENCAYVDSLAGIEQALADAGAKGIRVLTLNRYVPAAEAEGLAFEPLAAEPVREKHPWSETLVLGRLKPA